MMDPDAHTICRLLERPVDIYENQRFWVGRGFSRKGLLPTERKPYSTADGSLSFRTVREAALSLLRYDVVANSGSKRRQGRRGWSYHEYDGRQQPNAQAVQGTASALVTHDEDSDYECSVEDGADGGRLSLDERCGFEVYIDENATCDHEGWSYFPDFNNNSMLSPNNHRGLLDFVRRRKLRRVAIFRPDFFLPKDVFQHCDFCDSKVVDDLSSAMLDALCLATLYVSRTSLTDAQVLPLKAQLIDTLAVGTNRPDGDKEHASNLNINKVKIRLTAFPEVSVGKPQLVQLVQPGYDDSLQEGMSRRRQLISNNYLSYEERTVLARLVIKDTDRYRFQMHCDSCSCREGDRCEYTLMTCPNDNCTAIYSRKYRDEHDEVCGYRRVPCPSGCGAAVARMDLHKHVRDECPMREAACPLSVVGCTACVRAGDISRHLSEGADAHFVLVANRMMEYQQLFRRMDGRIKDLEERNAMLENVLRETAAKLQSKDDAKSAAGDVKKLDKRIGVLETKCKTEFRKIENERRN